MSPVFRHGRLRLYLLKLLDESPRHGYEVIRLLQDRFMGVYAPSPGTIYPRLARLEEDGLVTHEEVDGKKVYSITDKGREEIRSRLTDLADLEDELTESLRDVAREISEDVRDTVRTIREELASAAREFRSDGGKGGRDRAGGDRAGGDRAGGDKDASDKGASDRGASDRGASDKASQGTASAAAGSAATGPGDEDWSGEARRMREEARRGREQMRARFRAQGRSHGDWAAWAGRSGRADRPPWSSWADWAGSWADWTGSHDEQVGGRGFAEGASAGPGASSGAQTDSAGQQRSAQEESQRARRGGPNPFSDLERMAMQFATELRAAARQTGNIGERSLNDLRDILTDTLAKVRAEVFSDPHSSGSAGEAGAADGAAAGQDANDNEGPAGT
jgi:DNA-binding PadR family transcriptional regulator